MKLHFEFHFKEKEGFKEIDFLDLISKRLSSLSKEMPIKSFLYKRIQEGYMFEVEYQPVLQGFSYQIVLGCFGDLDIAYPYISNISMPVDKMFQK